MGPLARAGLALLVALAPGVAAAGCPLGEFEPKLRRAVTRVEIRPEVEAWSRDARKGGAIVQYVLLLEETVERDGACHWTVEVRADGRLWRRYLVTPDGRNVWPQDLN